MKSISKYCTPLKQKQLELCSSQIFRRSVPSSTNLPLVQKRIQSCYLPGEVGGAFERESLGSSALIWAMGDGRTLAVIRNRDIGSGNTSEHWLKWPWNWAMLEYRLWLRCCPSSLSEALVECWLVMLWDVWCAPFLVLFRSDLREVDQSMYVWNLFSRVAEILLQPQWSKDVREEWFVSGL